MKRLVVELNDSLHKEIKAKAFESEKTIKQYVTEMLEKAVAKDEQKKE